MLLHQFDQDYNYLGGWFAVGQTGLCYLCRGETMNRTAVASRRLNHKILRQRLICGCRPRGLKSRKAASVL